jgi:hypothetical protein
VWLALNLPPEAVTWRHMHGRPDLLQFFDAWTRTFIRFQSGEKVRLPDPVPRVWAEEHPVQAERKKGIIAALSRALGGK